MEKTYKTLVLDDDRQISLLLENLITKKAMPHMMAYKSHFDALRLDSFILSCVIVVTLLTAFTTK
jgi:hypothetical protein